ncbi:hypothetical protein BJX99DRAFT_232887 [Aspergillus californicus]
MHAKYLTLLALSALALGQDWYDDAMDALESTTDIPKPTGSTDAPTLDEWLDDSDYLDDIDTTNDFGSSDDSSSSASPTSSSSSSDSSSDDLDTGDSDSADMFGDIPSSILTELATAIPTSVLEELATPASASSLYSEIQAGDYPAWVTDLPDDVRGYLESAWGVDTEAIPTGSSSSSSSSSDDDSSNSSNNDSGEDAAGMLSPSVFGSIVGAVGVLAVALAL